MYLETLTLACALHLTDFDYEIVFYLLPLSEVRTLPEGYYCVHLLNKIYPNVFIRLLDSPSTEKSVGIRAHFPTLCALEVVRVLHAFMPLSIYSVH